MTTVVLVDDHLIVRQGIRRLLMAQEEYTVVGETNLNQGLPFVAQSPAQLHDLRNCAI